MASPKTRGRKPSFPKAGYTYPCMYRDNMYKPLSAYEAQLKVYIRNTWDWITVSFRKSDIDYINRHCTDKKSFAPFLQKKGHEWFLVFAFEEQATLNNTHITDQKALAVDLGLNSATAVSVLDAKGTISGRKFLKLPKEYDSLTHALNRIKKAQQHHSYKTPRLWAKANGINKDIAAKTAKLM